MDHCRRANCYELVAYFLPRHRQTIESLAVGIIKRQYIPAERSARWPGTFSGPTWCDVYIVGLHLIRCATRNEWKLRMASVIRSRSTHLQFYILWTFCRTFLASSNILAPVALNSNTFSVITQTKHYAVQGHSRSFEVTDFGTNGKLESPHTNSHPLSDRFQVIEDYWPHFRFRHGGERYLSLTHSFGMNP